MKLIYSHPHFTQVSFVRSLLANERIPSMLRNGNLSSLAGGIPAHETWPQLWVADEDAFLALSLVSQFKEEPDTSLENWICPRCGVENEGNMALCWNCDYEIDAEQPPE